MTMFAVGFFLCLFIWLTIRIAETAIYNEVKDSKEKVQLYEELPTDGIRELTDEERRELRQSSQDYQKINWIAEYKMENDPIVISIAPLCGEKEGVYVLGFTNIGNEHMNVAHNNELDEYFTQNDCEGVEGCTIDPNNCTTVDGKKECEVTCTEEGWEACKKKVCYCCGNCGFEHEYDKI